MNIQEKWLQIKNLAGDLVSEWGILALVFMLSLASFGLGRLSALEAGRQPVVIQQAAAAAASPKKAPKKAEEQPPAPASGQVVASKNGKAYYFPWCGGASRIAEKNRVYFDTPEAAKAAGYAPAKNCKGLE